MNEEIIDRVYGLGNEKKSLGVSSFFSSGTDHQLNNPQLEAWVSPDPREEYPPLKPDSTDDLEPLGVEENGLSIFEVFFHHLRVLRFQLLIVEELEDREDVFSEDFIQPGQES